MSLMCATYSALASSEPDFPLDPVSADSVVLSVSEDHASVKAGFSCFSSGNDFQLCGKEVFLFKIISIL